MGPTSKRREGTTDGSEGQGRSETGGEGKGRKKREEPYRHFFSHLESS